MLTQTRSPFLLLVIAGLVVGIVFAPQLHAQELIGGPYEPDSATVLLMHFDGDLQNQSKQSADGQVKGTISFTDTIHNRFGKQISLNNNKLADSNYVKVPDTAALDLTGNWTVEVWVKPASPSAVEDAIYINSPVQKSSNYTLDMHFNNGNAHRLTSGWEYGDKGNGMYITSPYNILHNGHWYHLVFVRDTSEQRIYQLIHKTANDSALPGDADSLQLIDFQTKSYNFNESTRPAVTDQPLKLGARRGGATAWAFNGYMDEVRISNEARNFPVPPLIKNVTTLDRPSADKGYPIYAEVFAMSDATITSATLHYRLNSGDWKTESMIEEDNNRYVATIPPQSVGTNINYFVSAENSHGITNTQSAKAIDDTLFHSFNVWSDSTTVFSVDFDQNSGGPVDKSSFGADIAFYSDKNEPTYAEGDEGGNDQAMAFKASNSTWLESSSTVHQLTSFVIDLKFYARDSVPPAGTYLLAKGDPERVFESNYQAYLFSDAVLGAGIHAHNQMGPCGNLTHWCLSMNPEKDGTIEAETWYRVQLGIRGPKDLESDTGTIFSRYIDMTAQDTIAEYIYPVGGGAFKSEHSLKIGGLGADSTYFNGLIDDVTIRNYVPENYLPDSLKATQITESEELPRKVTLKDNYPNPFNPTTQIEFSLPQVTEVELTVYDILGRRVAMLVDGKQQAGQHSVTFDASKLSSGVYIYRLRADGFSKSGKMLLIK